MRLGIVASRFNEDISGKLLERARAEAEKLGIKDCVVVKVPGALEIPLALQFRFIESTPVGEDLRLRARPPGREAF